MHDCAHQHRSFLLLLCGTLCLVATEGQAADLGQPPRLHMPTHQRRADVLVVRERAGVPAAVRQRLLATAGAQEIGRLEALGAAVIRVPHGRWPAVARHLRRSSAVLSVERDAIAAAAQVPTDPYYPQQWGLEQIGAPAAWDLTMGTAAVVVAVVDSGIDLTHPDLQHQVVAGYDFVNDDADASDDNGHGTRMAGIVAAEAFNGVGIAGVAPASKLMPVKVLGADGTGAYSTIANGITYAADQGVRVINLSLAGTAPSDLLQSAVAYATARGTVVVAATGNYGSTSPTYPAAYPHVIAVAATDQADSVPSFSNSGSWVALAAPGVSIMTTNRTAGGSPAYVGSSGTSPAAAFVSGAFALVFSAHPELTSTAAGSLLVATAHPVGGGGWSPSAGWGRIDVAAALGVTPGPSPSPTPIAPTVRPLRVRILSPTKSSLLDGDVRVDITTSDDTRATAVELLVDGAVVATAYAAPFGFTWDASTVAPGLHTLRARATDAAGRRQLSRPVQVRVTNGVALAVTHARLAPWRRSRALLTARGVFRLPDGTVPDQSLPTFSASLTSPTGIVFATMPDAGTSSRTIRGHLHLHAAAGTGDGTVTLVATRAKRGPNYQFALLATGVNIANAAPTMNLTLTVNGNTLSQSVTFRPRKASYMFP